MPALSHLKNVRGSLASAFGIHLVQGYGLLEDVTAATGEEQQIIVLQALGDGHGAGWDGPQEVTYRGHAIGAENYHFHAGTFSKGEDDAAQGIDSWFPGGITYNGTAYMVAKLPPGAASEGNATELQGIYRCLKLPNFNAAGQQIDKDGAPVPDGANPEDYFYYSANPARVAAWLIIYGRGLKPSRVDWAAWVAWRDYCDELIEWEDGTTTERADFAWKSSGNITPGDGGRATKTGGIAAWDSGTVTESACPVSVGNHRGIQFTAGTVSTFTCGLTTSTVVSGPTWQSATLALYCDAGGVLRRHGGSGVPTIGTWAAGDVFRVVDEAGVWKAYKNGAPLNLGSGLPAVPTGALYGIFTAHQPGAHVSAAAFNPAADVSTVVRKRMIPRFEAHIAFTQPTSLQDALDQVCFMACADWQETPKIRFLTPQPAAEPGAELHAAQRTIVHHFDATDDAVDNIVRRSIAAYPADVRERWNFAEGVFRDLDHRNLIEDFVTDERTALQDAAGDAVPRIISPGQVNLGNMTRSQALRVLKWLMRLRSDRVWFCELRAAADSLHVLPGDVVKVSHETYNWVEKLFLVIDATDDEEGADERSFVLQEYDPDDYYKDTDHSRGQITTRPPVPSPFQPPQPVESVVLEETQTPQADGTVISGIRGTVTFAGFRSNSRQRGRVWIKPSAASSSAWVRAGTTLLSPSPEDGTDVFEVRGVEKIAYDIKVVTEAENTTQLPFSAHQTFSITIVGKQVGPPAPTGLAATMGSNGLIVWSCVLPSDADFSFIRVYDGTGVIVRTRVDSNTWEEAPAGSSMTRKVKAVNRSGIESAFSTPLTFTLPSPMLPANITVTRDRSNAIVRWTAIEDLDYQVSLDQSAILWSGKGAEFIHAAAITAAGTYTYSVRSVRFGVASAWAQGSLVVGAPANPTGAVLARQGRHLLLTWTALAEQDYQVATANDGTGILWTGRGASFRRENAVAAAGIYTLYVRTLLAGVPSGWTQAQVTVNPPAAPSNFTLTRRGRQLLAAWTKTDGFEYEYATANDGTGILWRGSAGQYTDTSLPATAATYTRYVRAIEEGIAGAWATAQITISAPAAPSGFTLARHGRQLLATWTKIDGFEYEYATANDGTGILWRGSAGQYTDTSLPATAGTFTRYVRAIEDGIAGAWASAQYTRTAPAAPSGFSLSLSRRGDQIIAKWTKTDGFEYEYATANDGTGILWRGSAGQYTDTSLPAVAATYTRYVRAIEDGLAGAFSSAQITLTPPGPPASAAGSFDGLNVVWALTEGPSKALTYRAKDTSGNLLADDIGLQWKQRVQPGTITYTVRFYSVDALGIESTTFTQQSFTVPVPAAPTFVLSAAPEALVHDVAPNAADPLPMEFELARSNDGTNIIGRVSDRSFSESLSAQSPTSRTFTRYARAINAAGRTSAFASASTNYQPITAAPTLTPDTARANNVSLPVHVATLTPRAYVRNIIVQVRAAGGAWPGSTAEGTSGVYRFGGQQRTVFVQWDAGGSVEYRVALEDILTQTLADHVWTTTQSFTFPRFLDSAIDPSANFLRKANYRYPIFTGGGQIDWTSDFKVKWSQDIIVEGVGTLISSAGRVTLAANAAGTTLAAGEGIIYRHVLGATSASAHVVTLATYTPPDETSTTTEFLIFRRNADNTLSTYLLMPLNPGEHMDASVHIPLLSSQEARLGSALITKANIKSLDATQIDVDVLTGRIIFGDLIGSTDFVQHGSMQPQTEAMRFDTAAFANVTFTGGSAKKTGGTNGLDDAYVTATRAFHHLPTGGVYGSFVIGSSGLRMRFGLSSKRGTLNFNEMEAQMLYNAGNSISIYESGTLRGSPWAGLLVGDELRVVVSAAGVVSYEHWRGDSVLATISYGTTLTRAPLYANAVLTDTNAVVTPGNTLGVMAPAVGEKIPWQNLTGFSFDAADDLTKTAADAWGNAGCSSVDTIPAGVDGGFTFEVAGLTSRALICGLSVADTNQDWASVGWGAFIDSTGNLLIYESGTLRLNAGMCSVGDLIRVAREGGVIKYRRNGARVYTSLVSSNGAALLVDTSVHHQNAKIKTARMFLAGAVGQGWGADRTGRIEARSLVVGDYSLDEVSIRAAHGTDSKLQYRGNDYGLPLPHKVKAAKVFKWKYELHNPYSNEVGVQLQITLPDGGSDAYANMDSIRRVQVNVLDRFGNIQLSVPPQQFTPGGGLTAWFWHPLKYAHPADDATYEIRLENAYGWSKPFYVARGTFQLTPPSYFNKRDCPVEAFASSEGVEVWVGWMPAQQNAGQQTFQYRELGAAAWTTVQSNLLSTTDRTSNSTTLYPGVWYEFRVGNNSVTGAFSNVVIARLNAQQVQPDYDDPTGLNGKMNHHPPPHGVTARPVSQTTNRVKWVAPVGGQINPDSYTIWRDGTNIATGQTGTSYDDATATAGVTYRYQVQAQYGVNFSPRSNPAVCTTQAALNATDPTNLTATPFSTARIDLAWLLNGNVGAVTLEWKVDDGTYSSGWTTISLSAGTVSYQWALGSAETRYAFRVKAGSSNYTNIATAETLGIIPEYD